MSCSVFQTFVVSLSVSCIRIAQPEHPVSLTSVIVPRTCTSVFDDDDNKKSICRTSRHNVSKLHVDFARAGSVEGLSAIDVERRNLGARINVRTTGDETRHSATFEISTNQQPTKGNRNYVDFQGSANKPFG